MDFNFKKLASEAGGFFNRAKQLTEETFLKAERTELDAHFENLLQRADKTEEHTRRLLGCIESYLQPNPISSLFNASKCPFSPLNLEIAKYYVDAILLLLKLLMYLLPG